MPCKILEPSKSLVYLDFCIVYLPRYYLLAAVQLKSRWDRRYDKDNLVHKSLVGLRLKHMPRETNYTLSWTKRKRINYMIKNRATEVAEQTLPRRTIHILFCSGLGSKGLATGEITAQLPIHPTKRLDWIF